MSFRTDDLEQKFWRDDPSSADPHSVGRTLLRELETWRGIALYLADCCSATAGYALMLKATSAGERRRHISILRAMLKDITSETDTHGRLWVRSRESVLQRIQGLLNEYEEKPAKGV